MPTLADLTVIVPTRNEAANIGAFLGSLPDEVPLIVVDKSTDDTRALVRHHRPANTTVLEYAGTLTAARQIGAEHAATRWLLFTDADVVFATGYFARLSTLLRSQPANRVWFGPKLSSDAYRRYYGCFAVGQRLLGRLRIPAASGSNLIVAADAFAAVNGFDTTLPCNEDSELVWRLAGARFGWVFDRHLVVWATDHRRLQRGRLFKAVHTVLRCSLLYFDLVPERWRGHDWGYWAEPRSNSAPPLRRPS
jgi:glycosyltransferase involved in cell wall biosynthesis